MEPQGEREIDLYSHFCLSVRPSVWAYVHIHVCIRIYCMHVCGERERRTTVPACPGSIETFNPHLFSHDGFVKAAQSAGFLPPHTRTRTRARERLSVCLSVCLTVSIYIRGIYIYIEIE